MTTETANEDSGSGNNELEPNDSATADEDYTRNLNLRQNYIELLAKASADFDKTLLTIAGGSLGLSLTFTDKVIDLQKSDARIFLLGAWFLLALAMLGSLWSHYASMMASSQRIQKVHQEMGLQRPEGLKQSNRDWALITDWLNRIALVVTMVGVVSAVLFCAINVWEMPKQKSEKGIVPPDLPPPPKPKPKPKTSTSTSSTTETSKPKKS